MATILNKISSITKKSLLKKRDFLEAFWHFFSHHVEALLQIYGVRNVITIFGNTLGLLHVYGFKVLFKMHLNQCSSTRNISTCSLATSKPKHTNQTAQNNISKLGANT